MRTPRMNFHFIEWESKTGDVLCGKELDKGLSASSSSLPSFHPAHWWKVHRERSPPSLPAEISVQETSSPVSVLTLRLYLLQARDLRAAEKEKKEKWLLLSNMSFQSLMPCYAFEDFSFQESTKLQLTLSTEKCGMLWREVTHCSPTARWHGAIHSGEDTVAQADSS